MKTQITTTPLEGLLVVNIEFFRDERGFFIESWRKEVFAEAGIDFGYTNVFWGGRSEIKPSEIAPEAYRQFCIANGLDPDAMRDTQ